MLKPLTTLVDELERNLASHLEEGPLELLLGVGPRDPARPVAERFAREHPDRVRVVVHEEATGLNPKVNQLIALTREARGEVLACTDASIRVPEGWLRDVVAALELPGVGVATNMLSGGEARTLAAAWDAQALTTFVAPNVAVAAVAGMDQIVGKSLALRRDVLEALGGWERFKDVLGEDQLLGAELARLGLRSHVCPLPVVDVAPERTLAAFWERHTRWSAIRFRLLRPGAHLEPLLNPTVFALAATLLAPRRAAGLALSAVASAAFARTVGAPRPATFPLQQVVFFAVWLRGSTIRTVSWQGHRLRMGVRSRLSVPEGGS